jgi:hypothetical protein
MHREFDWPGFQLAFREAAEAGGFFATKLTESSAGEVTAWERPSPGKRVYLSAGIHGDEPAGPLALLELLHGGFFDSGIHWILCPALNPAGLQKISDECRNQIENLHHAALNQLRKTSKPVS